MSTGTEAAELVAFLRTNLDEDEQTALDTIDTGVRAAMRRGGPVPRWEFASGGEIRDAGGTLRVKFTWAAEAAHITRWDPARVLRDVDAGRKLVSEYEEALRIQSGFRETGYEEGRREALEIGCRLLAARYADMPGYKERWRPS